MEERSQVAERGRLPQVRKAPSLSTFNVPTLNLRAPSKSLVKAFASLISRLPQENRDLTRTVAELIRGTAMRSKETKMPLSNLMLVFCPSLAMSPPLLRVLCEAENIWDGPLDDDVIEEGKEASESAESTTTHSDEASGERLAAGMKDGEKPKPIDLMRRRQSGARGRVATIYLPSSPRDVQNRPPVPSAAEISDSGTIEGKRTSSDGDSTRKQSTPEDGRSPVDPTQLHPPSLSAYSPPSLTSSSESLSTPASTSGDEGTEKKEDFGSPPRPQTTVRSQSDLPSPRKVRKASIGNPIAFPTAPGGSVPVTPIEIHAPLRLSTYSSSSPDLHPDTMSRRKSKASLTDLFPRPKRSLSSLLGRSPSTPDSNKSFLPSPDTRVNISSTPPVLDFTLDQSPIKLGLGLDLAGFDDSNPNTHHLKVPGEQSQAVSAVRMQSATSTNSTSSSSGVYYTPPTTSRTLNHTPSLASFASSGSYSLLEEFGFDKEIEEGNEGDWASSVLKAANDSKS